MTAAETVEGVVIARYLAGESMRSIALSLGWRSGETVRKLLRRAGVPGRRRGGRKPLVATREGDRQQARWRVKNAVRHGRAPRPSDLPCTDCGHIWQAGGSRHEYDHYLGYAAPHQLDVQCVCRPCHTKRSTARGELPRGADHYARTTPVRLVAGGRHAHAKLTSDQVDVIRARLALGHTLTPIAIDFGVSPSTIWSIAHGRTWRTP